MHLNFDLLPKKKFKIELNFASFILSPDAISQIRWFRTFRVNLSILCRALNLYPSDAESPGPGRIRYARLRCRMLARMVALIYSWWTLYVRLINPESHEASLASRRLLMSLIGRLAESGNQKKIKLTSWHHLMNKITELQSQQCDFPDLIKGFAPQLSSFQVWWRILTKAISKFLQSAGWCSSTINQLGINAGLEFS